MTILKLYHYSNIDISGYIKPDYYGLNFYTTNDKNITNVKRAFYYTKPEPEHLLSHCKFLYIIEVNKNKIVDLRNFRNRILKKFTDENDNVRITELLRYIKQKGYKGVIYNTAGCYNVITGGIDIVNLFCRAKILKKERIN